MSRRIALTRPVSDSIEHCELTHLERIPIDLERARAQHRAYEDALRTLGCTVVQLPARHDLPDAVFVEDMAVVLDEIAILASPGAASRFSEMADVAAAIAPFRTCARILPPGTLDGGDVMRIGRTLYAGRSGRTNAMGIELLRRHVESCGYTVRAVDVTSCLHLKSAVTAIADDVVLLNPEWVDPEAFPDAERLEVDPAEPFAANALRIDDSLLFADHFPRTRARLEAHGFRVLTVPAGEFAKAEGGVTCCSLIVSLNL